jgi:polysaccharide chain length determinant protein (PEP-CTERM system associated)
MATPVHVHDDSARGAGLATVLEIVRRRRLLALLPFAFVLAAAASLAFFLPSLWTARATILVNRQEIPEAFVKSTVNTDVDARLLTLSQDVLDTPRLSKIIQENDLYPALRRTKPMPDVVERMRKDIAIDVKEPPERRGREATSLVFTVAYTTTDPVVSARVTNTLASLFSEENRRQREQQAVGTSEFLEAQLRELRGKLAAQEQKITAYKEQHLGELPEQKEVNLRTLERLQQQLSLAYENNRRASERRQNISQSMNNLDLASAMAGSPGAASIAGPTVTPAESAAARLSILKQELAALQTTYSDKYPDVIQMKEQIRITERRAAEEEKRLAAAHAAAASPGSSAKAQLSRSSRDMQLAVQNPYVLSLMQQRDQADVEAKASADEIKGLSGQIAMYQRRLEMTPKREQELALITRDYDTTRDMFRQLLAKRGEADVAAELEQRQKGERFRVIDQARLPERPAGPNRLRLLIVGLVLALGAAGVAVVLAEQVDTSYRRAEEVRAIAGVPVLSTIPRIVTEDDRLHAARQRRMALAAVAVGLLAIVGTSFMVAHNNQSLVTLLTPDATAAVKR